ncbi:MAG: SiaB family protein kinase [Flavobacteriales bacterium]|nr:SiaB family protein kinase [Flavobacteriales bacterium]
MSTETEIAELLIGKISQGRILCVYFGEITFPIIDNLLINIKEVVKKRSRAPIVAKRTYRVLVECLENVHKHSVDSGNGQQKMSEEGVFLLIETEDKFRISVGNRISKNERIQLKRNIDHLNSISYSELKQLHRKVRMNGGISEKGGAGLGLIEIAMNSGQKIEYEFYEQDEDAYFFFLEVQLENI